METDFAQPAGERPQPQRRGRRIAMTDAELDDFLAEQRTLRLATTGPSGPHATPLWFLWHADSLWLYSLVRSRRWAQLLADPRVGAVVDAGVEYGELRGVELTGRVEVVGETPRTGADPRPDLAEVERVFAGKYFDLSLLHHDGKHGWLRLRPQTIVSWDFRKLADA